MSIMALFNTLHRKRERNFLSVCKTFEKEGVETIEAAESCRRVMLSNAKIYVIFVTMVGLSLTMIFQSVYLPILVGMGIVLLYIITSVYRARDLVQRYIEEVLKDPEFVPYSQRVDEDSEEKLGLFSDLSAQAQDAKKDGESEELTSPEATNETSEVHTGNKSGA